MQVSSRNRHSDFQLLANIAEGLTIFAYHKLTELNEAPSHLHHMSSISYRLAVGNNNFDFIHITAQAEEGKYN